MRAIKLPNGNIVLCDEDEMIEVSNVSIHLSSVISNDIEGFLDLLSEQATGCAGLMDINYDLCHCNPGGASLFFTLLDVRQKSTMKFLQRLTYLTYDYEVLTTLALGRRIITALNSKS